jgi:hypothetical protein
MVLDPFIFEPLLLCRRHPRTCAPIVLPYPNLRAEGAGEHIPLGENHPLLWPRAAWSACFGCTSCGFVSQYTASDVLWDRTPKSAPGVYHSGANCFCVEFRCGRGGCALPTKLHIDNSRLTQREILRLLRSAYFMGSLPCGHDFLPLPANQYSIFKIMDRIE